MAESEVSAAGSFRSAPGFAVSLLAAALPGLYLLITSTTTLIHGIWPYDAKRMLQFALLLVLFLLPAANRRIREELGALLASVPRWIGLMLLGGMAWGVLSAAVNARPGWSATGGRDTRRPRLPADSRTCSPLGANRTSNTGCAVRAPHHSPHVVSRCAG